MITINKELTLTPSYPVKKLGNPKKVFFFDIETTGFSAVNSMVYMIGGIYFDQNKWQFIQWFADEKSSEREILDNFFHFIHKFSAIITFNGDTFDIPFLKKRAALLGLKDSFALLDSIDIYKKVKSVKDLLGLNSCRQKSVEAFLRIDRDDEMSGGELISVYEHYTATKNEAAYHLLLLHNEDDLKGMPQILSILSYSDYFNGTFHEPEIQLTQQAGNEAILLSCSGDTRLPIPIQFTSLDQDIQVTDACITMELPLIMGRIRHYYSDYQNYYYLPQEDTAIHKSLAEFVNKKYRRKATRDTCYTWLSYQNNLFDDPQTLTQFLRPYLINKNVNKKE